jgi:PST family polysaccharide transporter
MIGSGDWKNITALYGTRAVEYLLPWLYLPVLLRIIGPELFGVLALATAVSQYALILVEFGYPFSGVRTVALVRNDTAALSEFVSSALQLRLAVAAASMLAVLGIVAMIPVAVSTRIVIIATCASVFGTALLPQFVFQGLEKFRPLSKLNIVTRLTAALGIIILVRTPEEFILVPVVHTSMALVSGLAAVVVLLPQYGVRLKPVPFHRMANEFRCQKGVVVSGMATSLYTATNTVVLGMFATPLVVGYYAAAEKLVRALQQVFSPVQTLLMPQVAKEAEESSSVVLVKLVRLLGGLTLFVVPASLLLAVFALEIVQAIFGPGFSPASTIVRILSPLPFIMICTLVCTDLFLLGFGQVEVWRNIINWSALAGIVLALASAGVFRLGAEGMAVVLLVTEGMIVVRSADHFVRAFRARMA